MCVCVKLFVDTHTEKMNEFKEELYAFIDETRDNVDCKSQIKKLNKALGAVEELKKSKDPRDVLLVHNSMPIIGMREFVIDLYCKKPPP